MRFFAVALIFFGAAASYAQTPQVPHKMHFADMTLAIRDDARREIQQDVDTYTKHARYFQMKAERAKTYFPIISKIFAEEGLPDDFKYLVLQESALVPDAVSVSNAVGFWQFKDFTALSMGMRVDKEVDERMNIVSATRGAANYLKQNNAMFDNWLLALQAYQMGAGGLKRLVGEKHNGKRHMEINSETYWYVKKFIAHKVAFESFVDGEPQVKVVAFESKKTRSLTDLANELQVDESTLREYNKWALRNHVPDDKTYTVIVPTTQSIQDFSSLTLSSEKSSKARPMVAKTSTSRPEIKFINGLRAVKSLPNESLTALTDRAGITLSRFLKFNEMEIDQGVEVGSYYFLERKKSKGEALQHRVRAGEDLWSIAQTYGIRVGKLEKWNRMSRHEKLQIGAVVKLNSKFKLEQPTPRGQEVPTQEPVVAANVQPIKTIESNKTETDEVFGWEIKPVESKRSEGKEVKIDSLASNDQNPPEVAQDREHIVSAGESLYSISKLHGVQVSDLLTWNKLSVTDGLKIGQKLLLNRQNSFETVHTAEANDELTANNDPLVHKVSESDTLYSIARQYGVTIKQLMDWNEKKDLTIKPGEMLKISKR